MFPTNNVDFHKNYIAECARQIITKRIQVRRSGRSQPATYMLFIQKAPPLQFARTYFSTEEEFSHAKENLEPHEFIS